MKNSYWITVAKRALREASELSRFDNIGRTLVASISIIAVIIGGYAGSTKFNDVALKVESYIVAMIGVALVIFIWKIWSIPPKMCREMAASMDIMVDELSSLKDRLKSKIVLKLDHESVLYQRNIGVPIYGFCVNVANAGEVNASDCTVMVGLSAELNSPKFNRGSLKPASGMFFLRPHEIERFPVVFHTGKNEQDQYGLVEGYVNDTSSVFSIGMNPAKLSPAAAHVVVIEVLATNLPVTRIAALFSFDGEAGWQLRQIEERDEVGNH